MIALRKKNVVEDKNILYLECECGCNIIVMEYWPRDKSFTLWPHDTTAIRTLPATEYLAYEHDDAVKIFRDILSLKTATAPTAFMYAQPVDEDTDEPGCIYLVVDNYSKKPIKETDENGVETTKWVLECDEEISISCFRNKEEADAALANMNPEDKTIPHAAWAIIVSKESAEILYQYVEGLLANETNNKN